MARELLTQVELLETACKRALAAEDDSSTRDALLLAIGAYVILPYDRPQIDRAYIKGLANMARVHAEQLGYRLKTSTGDAEDRRATRMALEQVCRSLADLHRAILETT